MMSNCFCFRKYQCLSCERNVNRIARQGNVVSKSVRVEAQCGTRAGYNRHLRLKESTCVECRAAQTAAVIEAKRKKVAA